jgi:hypothetical protein
MMSGGRRDLASYDDILRRTVPEPDLSFRPSRDEEKLSRHRFGVPTEHRVRPLSVLERRTLERVEVALDSDPTLDLSGVEIAIDGREIVLLGSVPGPSTSVRIEDIVGAIDGVDRIDNALVIRGVE